MNFLFNIVVWGENYTEFFLDVALKAQLAPGNLPRFLGENQGQCKYLIYTTAADAERIRTADSFQHLSRLIATEFVLIETLDNHGKDIRKTPVLCNAHAIKLAAQDGYRVIFLVPDMIFSDGSFVNLLKIARTGKRVVMMGYFRTLWESFVPEFKRLYSTESPYIAASSRELIKLALNHLHPETKSWIWGSPNFRRRDPVFLYTTVQDKGMIERSFHLHPVMLCPDQCSQPPGIEGDWSIDGSSYLSQAFPDFAEYYVVQDSDEVFALDLLPFDERYQNYIKPGRFNYLELLLWPTRHAYASHFFNYRHKIYFHVEDIDSSWQEAEHISDTVVAALESMLELSNKNPDIYQDLGIIYDERSAAIEEKNSLIQIAVSELAKQKCQIVEGLNELGKLQQEIGKSDQAVESFSKAIEIAPEQPEAHICLASLYAQQEKYFEAFKHIRKTLENDPDNPEALHLANNIINSGYHKVAEAANCTAKSSLRFLIVVPRFIASYGQYYIFPLGLAYISAALKQKGYDVYTVNLNHITKPVPEIITELIIEQNIDVVCTGGLSIHYRRVKEIIDAAQIAKGNIITIVGGGLLSSEPEVVMDGLGTTYGVIGEGERTIVELAEALKLGATVQSIDGIIYRKETGALIRTAERKPIDDLDSIPYPDYEGFGFTEYLQNMVASDERELAVVDNPRPISVISSRSCPFSCTFCYHPLGKKYRQRSLDSFFAELEHWIQTYNINIVFIMDELFSLHKERIYEFCARIKQLNIKWVVQLTVKGISSETLNTMREAGCYLISYGLESGSNDVLKSMKKPITVSDINKVLEITYSTRIGVQGNFIFGDVAESVESIVETLSLWLRLQHKYYIYMIPIEVYPGTELYNCAISNGILDNKLKYIEDSCPSMNLTSMPDDLYLRALLLVYILRKSFLAIQADLLNFEPTAYHPVKGQLYKVRVICPHCSETVEYNNLAHFDMFMTGCRLCNRRFDIFDTIRKPGAPINSELSTSYRYSEAHAEEMRLFLTPSNFDWLLQNNLELDNFSSRFMAIKLFENTYLLPQEFSADDIRYSRLPLFLYKDNNIQRFYNI